ncbi:MAG TPA: LacI family DNA-binding transcriptional regulator [Actinomycetota bacterium]|nr:LacI family DNA-binding transcriptional regulator [Actinomycetota bacterium]
MNRFASPGRRVTIGDVASLAGVSKTTVSHVISGNRPVSTETRSRVETAIADLGYRPDGVARSLRTRRTHVVALIIPDITNPFYPVLSRGLEHALAETGYRTFICSSDGDTERELDFLAEVFDRRVDGIVLDSFHIGVDDVMSITRGGVPMVWIGGSPGAHPGVDSVRPDDEHGAFEATMHLVEHGHRAIAIVDGPAGSGTSRRNGYLRALETAGIQPPSTHLVRSDWTREGGASALRRLLRSDPRPTAIFCSNDRSAIGVIDAAHERGLGLPDDLAVVGFDDIEEAAMTTPPLTTVRNPAFETGEEAGRLLGERMSGAYRGAARDVQLPATLVVRASS